MSATVIGVDVAKSVWKGVVSTRPARVAGVGLSVPATASPKAGRL